MVKRRGILVLFLALSCLLFCSGSAMAAKGFKHLSFMGGYMEKHPTVVNVFFPFLKAAEEKFDGKLSFDYFSTGSLYPETESFRAISDNRVDFGEFQSAFFPGKMPLLEVVALPGLCRNAIVGSLVVEELIQKFPEVRAELPPNSVHFASWASAAYQIHTIQPVRNMEELKGRKIIVWDSIALELVKALGANPIRMSSPDTYLALSKGMADGVLCPLAPIRSYKITESTKYHLILSLSVNTFTMEANKDIWDAMPEDMRAWLSAQGGLKMSEAIGKSLEDGARADMQWMKDQGHQFYYLNDEQEAAMLVPFEPFVENWRKEAMETLDAALVDEVLAFVRERSAFHQAEMDAGMYGNYGKI